MKILIIDDDNATTELISMILAQMGEEILVAHSGEEGLRITHEGHPDMIVLDMMMPVMDGLQTCKAIRRFSDIPILMLSAVDNPCVVASLLNAGADDYLIKPVGVAILAARVRKLTRRPGWLPVPIGA
jgi:DNA-binding response OmpR family regulator